MNEKKVEHNCHFGILFGTGIVEAKHLDEIEKLIPNWGPFKPESAILEYCCASLYGKVLRCLKPVMTQFWSFASREVTLCNLRKRGARERDLVHIDAEYMHLVPPNDF